jgi:hypothetical protein
VRGQSEDCFFSKNDHKTLSQLCEPLCLEKCMYCEHIVLSHCNMCVFGVYHVPEAVCHILDPPFKYDHMVKEGDDIRPITL